LEGFFAISLSCASFINEFFFSGKNAELLILGCSPEVLDYQVL
jgi:hypothetical protein